MACLKGAKKRITLGEFNRNHLSSAHHRLGFDRRTLIDAVVNRIYRSFRQFPFFVSKPNSPAQRLANGKGKNVPAGVARARGTMAEGPARIACVGG